MVTKDGLASWPGRRRLLVAVGLGFVAFMIAIEVVAAGLDFRGPSQSLLREFAYGPQRSRVLWAGFALAMVGLTRQQRLRAIGIGIGIDIAFIAGRAVAGADRISFGNGALWVMAGLAAWAATRWEGEQRTNALKGVGLGAMLIVASKVGDAWLRITAVTRPKVLDEYASTADLALGNPSWLVGKAVEATGSLGHLVLETVYIELPVAAIIVAVYQLRKGWPSHHLVRTFLLIGLIGPLFYLLFPVVGPIYAFGSSGRGYAVANLWPNLTLGDLTPGAIPFDRITPRNCMPSLHTAWTVAIFVHTRRGPTWLRWFGTVWMVCTLIATLGFGYHYGVDLIAGVVFSLTIEAGLRDPERGWGWFRWRLVGGGTVAMFALLGAYRFLAVPLAEVPALSGTALLGVLAAVVVAFYATFFARPDTPLGRWGRPDEATDPADVGVGTASGPGRGAVDPEVPALSGR